MQWILNELFIMYLQDVIVKLAVNISYKLKVGTQKDGLSNWLTLRCCSFRYPWLKSPSKGGRAKIFQYWNFFNFSPGNASCKIEKINGVHRLYIGGKGT